MSTTLYEIAAEHRELVAAIVDAGGEDEDGTYEEALDSVRGKTNDKVTGIIRARQNMKIEAASLKAQADVFADEARRLREAAQVQTNKAQRLGDYLASNLTAMGLQSVETNIGTVYRTKRTSLDVRDEHMVPSTYYVPQPDKLDKRALLKALVDGDIEPTECGSVVVEKVTVGLR
jgi:hypothetical protein